MMLEKYRPTMTGDVLHSWAADAQAELESLRKDAERYRWLRGQIERQRLVIAESCGWDGLKSWSGDDPDKHIDAALAKAPAVGAA
jgi:hypothetical protein